MFFITWNFYIFNIKWKFVSREKQSVEYFSKLLTLENSEQFLRSIFLSVGPSFGLQIVQTEFSIFIVQRGGDVKNAHTLLCNNDRKYSLVCCFRAHLL